MIDEYQHAGTRLKKIIDKNLLNHSSDDSPQLPTSGGESSQHTERRLDCHYRHGCDLPNCDGCLSISRGLK